MSNNIIDNKEYQKVKNYFKGIYKAKDWGILNYVNISSVDDLTQEYFLHKIKKGNKYKYPSKFYFDKIKQANNRKRLAPTVCMSRMTASDADDYDTETKEFPSPQNKIKYDLEDLPYRGNNSLFTKDLCVLQLSEILIGFESHVNQILSQVSLSEEERYYMVTISHDLEREAKGNINFTESELLKISLESIFKNTVENLLTQEVKDKLQEIEDHYFEFLSENGKYLLLICKKLANRGLNQSVLSPAERVPATAEEVLRMKQMPDELLDSLSKEEIFKLNFTQKCLLAGKNQREIKLLLHINRNRETALKTNNDRKFIDFSFFELKKLNEKNLGVIPLNDLYNLKYKDICDIIGSQEDTSQYDNHASEIDAIQVS